MLRWSVRAPWRVVAERVEGICETSGEGGGGARGVVRRGLSETLFRRVLSERVEVVWGPLGRWWRRVLRWSVRAPWRVVADAAEVVCPAS